MKKLYTLFILISISTVAYTQSHDENFGNPPSQMPLSNYTGWTSSLHFSGTAMIDTANPSLIDYTANYGPFSLASGAGNVSLNTVGSYLQVSSPYYPMIVELSLRFNIHGFDTLNPNEMALAVSLDSGLTWSPLPYVVGGWPIVPSLGIARLDSSGWWIGTSSTIVLLNNGAPWWEQSSYQDNDDVVFRFTQTAANKTIYIDDVRISSVVLLAIKLIDFDIVTTDKNTILNWRANTENTNEFFVLEKSKDGIRFEPLSTQNAKGNGEFEYEYADKSNITESFYRLKMVSDNGETEYSKVLMAGAKNNYNELLQGVYPNPARDVVHISLNNTKAEDITLMVTNLNGIRLIDQCASLKKGTNSYDLRIESLPPGTYFLTVAGNDRQVTRKIIVNR